MSNIEKKIFTDFSSFSKMSHPNSEKGLNTEITFDDHTIEFLINTGEKLNLKFKNKIENIFSLCDGILIKMLYVSDNFDFFYKSNQAKGQVVNYSYYIITEYPLNKINSLDLSTNASGENVSIMNLNIIKTSHKFPIALAYDINNPNILSVFLLLRKDETNSTEFPNYLNKILKGSVRKEKNEDNLTDNFFVFTQENTYALSQLSLFNLEVNNLNLENINFYTNFSQRKCIFISIFDKTKGKLIIFLLKFKQKGSLAHEKKSVIINNVISCEFIDSLISTNDNTELYEIKNSSNKNIMITFLNDKEKYNIKNQTLVYLGKDLILNFQEGLIIILRINLADYGLHKESILINSFSITQNYNYVFEHCLKNSTMDGDVNEVTKIRLNFKLSDEYLLNYIQYIKSFLDKEIADILLHDIFTLIHSATEDHFDLFTDFILYLLSTEKESVTQQNNQNIFSCDSFNYLSDFPIISEFLKQEELNINNMKEINRVNYSASTETLEYFSINRSKLILYLIEYSRLYYENLKIINFSSERSNKIANFIGKLLICNNDNNLTCQYISFFINSYHYQILPEEQLNVTFNNNNNNNNSLEKLYSFKDYLNDFIKSSGGTNISRTYSPVIFKNINNIMKILSVMMSGGENKQIMHEANDEQMSPEMVLFLPKYKNDFEYDPFQSNNIIHLMMEAGLTINSVKKMHPLLSLLLLDQVGKCKNDPQRILTTNNTLNVKLLNYIERNDYARNLNMSEENKGQKESQFSTITSMLYESESSHYEPDYNLTSIKFSEDRRFEEALRILHSWRSIKVDTSSLESGMQKTEVEKFNFYLRHLTNQFSVCIGAGAVGLNTIKTIPKDILQIKPLNLNVISSADDSTFKLDIQSEHVKDKEFLRWPEFHNGVSQILKLSTEYFSNKSYIRNWILFNKPLNASNEHGGFLLGLGLLKQLDSLFSTDIYQYMKSAHDGVSIGILLGRAASKISSMEESLSRTLCLHIAYLIPTTLEINIPMNIQCAASIGLGVLYLGTGNRLMTEMLLNQIGRKFNSEKLMNIAYIDSYNLCLGFAVGLINLSLGKSNINEDLKLEEKLLNFANGGRKINPLLNAKYKNSQTNGTANNNTVLFNSFKTTNQSYVEEFEINVKLTAPSAYVCLTLMYLQSENLNIANKLHIPQNLYQLETVRPLHLYLAHLTKNLIMWNLIQPSRDWILEEIPSFIKFLYEEKLSTIAEDMGYASIINSIEFSQVATAYFYCISAGIMSLGFKFAGTHNSDIANIVIDFIQLIRKVKVISSDIIVKEQNKYNDVNKYCLNKQTLDQCICICSYSLSLILAGSGNLNAFKILRIVRKKIEMDTKSSSYGHLQAIHHAIGILFLGAGGLSFSNSRNSIAFLYISTFPIFPTNTNDNDKYLQPLRHFYVLACEKKVLETNDVERGVVINTKLQITYKNGQSEQVTTPVNVDDFNNIKFISLIENKYYFLDLKMEDLIKKFNAVSMNTKTIYIKSKFLFEEEIVNSIKFLPHFMQLNNEEDLTNNICNNYLDNLFHKLSKFINHIDSVSISNKSILINILSNLFAKKHNNLSLKKNTLLLLIEYLRQDKLDEFYIIYDNLFKLNFILEKEEADYQIFTLFKDIYAILLHNIGEGNNEIK